MPPSEFGPFGRVAAQKVQKNRNGDGKMKNVRIAVCLMVGVLAFVSSAMAAVVIATVPVGDGGNAGDTRYYGGDFSP